jgi:hypothetical protein
MKNILVFCGASMGNRPEGATAARTLGKLLAENNLRLIYGGGQIGIMGVLANTTLENGGSVTGVQPRFLDTREITHNGLTELIWVETMHERKQKMSDLADAIIALPGGFGTMDELFEMLTWKQLDLHARPVGLLNVGGYYNGLVQQMDTMMEWGLLSPENRALLVVAESPAELLAQLSVWSA